MTNLTNGSTDDTLSACVQTYLAWSLIYISLSPVFMLVLCLGFQQWKQPQSSSASDIFTFNMAAVEIFGVVGALLSLSVYFLKNADMEETGDKLTLLATFGQILLHNLICLDRYLAVLHPITYMRLNKNGKLIRGVCIIVLWLSCFGIAVIHHFLNVIFAKISVIITGMISVFVVVFFSVSVLCALIRPGPGERGGDKRHVHQLKRRAFHTMTVVTVALMLKFVALFVTYLIYTFDKLTDVPFCLLAVSSQWLNLPSVIVVPGLFLHRRVREMISKGS